MVAAGRAASPAVSLSSLTGIRAITFDAGDTLVFAEPSLRTRIETALAANSLSWSEQGLSEALRAMTATGVIRYLAGEDTDSPGFARECSALLLRGLTGAEPSEGLAADVAASYAGLPYESVVSPDAAPLLRALRERGFKIGIVSDWGGDLVDIFTTGGCGDLIDAYAVSSALGVTKPSPLLFTSIAAALGVAPGEIVHVGDFLELDVIGALSAGLHAILYDWKRFYDSVAMEAPVARSFAELSALLLAIPSPVP